MEALWKELHPTKHSYPNSVGQASLDLISAQPARARSPVLIRKQELSPINFSIFH